MSAKPKQMHQVRIIFQMKKADSSIRNISKQTGICWKTIREYLGRLQCIGLEPETALKLTDEELSNLIIILVKFVEMCMISGINTYKIEWSTTGKSSKNEE